LHADTAYARHLANTNILTHLIRGEDLHALLGVILQLEWRNGELVLVEPGPNLAPRRPIRRQGYRSGPDRDLPAGSGGHDGGKGDHARQHHEHGPGHEQAQGQSFPVPVPEAGEDQRRSGH
jgi:hypothetical protein